MASIPLPALDIRPPENPLDQYAKALSVSSMLQGQKTQQLQQTALSQENQQREQALNDQKAMTSAMQEWDGKSYNDLVPLVVKHGGSAQAVIGLKGKVLEQQEKFSNIAKNDAETGAKNIETLGKQNDMLLGHIDAVAGTDEKGNPNVPDEQLVTRVNQEKNAALLGGYLDKDHAAAIDKILETGNPQQIRGALKIFEKSLQGQKEQFDQAKQTAELDQKNWKEIPGTGQFYNIKTNELKSPSGQRMTPQMAESQYIQLAQQKAKGEQISEDDQAFMKGFEKYKTLVPVANFNLQNQGMGGANGQPSEMAKAIANGQMKWSEAVSPRTPVSVKADLLKQVTSINPNFKSYDYDIEKKVGEQFTSGTYSQQLNAINTAREHMKTFAQMADALNNTDVQIVNKAKQAWQTEFGSEAPTNFLIAKDAFSGEVGKALAGANVTQGDRNKVEEAINRAESPAQLKGAAQTADALLEGKQKALKQTYEQGAKAKPNFGENGNNNPVKPTHRYNPQTSQIEEIK